MKFPDDYIGKIINDDCLNVLKQMPDKCVDLVLTDPPYCIGTTSNGKKASWLDNNLVLPFFKLLISEMKRVLTDEGQFYINTDWRTYPFLFYPINQEMNIENLIVWDYEWIKAGSQYRFSHEFIIFGTKIDGQKRTFSANERDVWRIPPINFTSVNKNHNAEKPIDLCKKMICNSSKQNSVILDPFAGSGTTLVAAELLGRKWIGIEISKEYCAIAEKRVKEAREQFALFEGTK